MSITTRTPTAEDFRVQWDGDRWLDFFEDDNGMYLWAWGMTPSDEFAAQANEVDQELAGDVQLGKGYTEADVQLKWAIVNTSEDGEEYLRIVSDTTSGAALVKVLAR